MPFGACDRNAVLIRVQDGTSPWPSLLPAKGANASSAPLDAARAKVSAWATHPAALCVHMAVLAQRCSDEADEGLRSADTTGELRTTATACGAMLCDMTLHVLQQCLADARSRDVSESMLTRVFPTVAALWSHVHDVQWTRRLLEPLGQLVTLLRDRVATDEAARRCLLRFDDEERDVQQAQVCV